MKDAATPNRNIAMDAYRGFVMFLMMAEVLRLSRVARAVPDSWFWSVLSYHQSHVPWAGCSLHDLIQPSFSFLVGAALPYSIASRIVKGQTQAKMFLHALWRSLVLVWLGIFLRSTSANQTNYTFEDTLTQIGMGYPFLFLLGFRPRRWHWIALALILVGYWALFAVYPVDPAFDYASVGVPADWQHHYSGLMSHWNKNSNYGAAFDRWFLNLLPRAKPFLFNGGGYLTLSFIPTLGTMILGLIAGAMMKESPTPPLRQFLTLGAALIAAGLAAHFLGVCPIVKRIWTPAWTLFSGGCCFVLLALFSKTTERTSKWAFPLIVIGANSITAYMIAHLWESFFIKSLRTHLGQDFFKAFGEAYEPFFLGAVVLLLFWLTLHWMYRRKIFPRV